MEIRRKALAQANLIIKDYNGESTEREEKLIKDINEYLFSINPPKDYSTGSDNSYINQLDISFENLCASMEEAGVHQPKKLTAFEFRQRVMFYQQKAKPNKAEEK